VRLERVRDHTFHCTLSWERTTGKLSSQEHTVRLAPVSKHFGGWEYYLVCPACSNFSKALYVDDLMLRCRGCARLVHRSTRQTAAERRREQLHKLESKLGIADSRGRPRRPSGMHHARFERLLDQLVMLRDEVAEADARERSARITRIMARKTPRAPKINTVDDSLENDVSPQEALWWIIKDHIEQRADRGTGEGR
jgi:hypothetical protein